MGAFLFQCPRTGMQVQGFAVEEAPDKSILPMWCAACRSYHLLDPAMERAKQKDK
jgi:hypothetical protein